jgi:hypothetical protein
VQRVLGIAASIGSQVEHWLLAIAAVLSEHEITTTLNSAIRYFSLPPLLFSGGYLVPNSDEYMRTVILSQKRTFRNSCLNQIVLPEFSFHHSPPLKLKEY